MAPSNGTTSTTQSWSSPSPLAPCNGTQQWHHVHYHPAMDPAMARSNGTQQRHHVHYPKVGRHPFLWHPAMAPSNGTTSTTPKLVVTLPSAPCNGTLQWHQQWHPATAPRPLPQSWSSPSPPTIAHYNGTLQWHHVHSPKPPPQP